MPSHAVLVVGGYLYIHYYCKFRHFFQGNFPVSVNYMNSLVKNNKSCLLYTSFYCKLTEADLLRGVAIDSPFVDGDVLQAICPILQILLEFLALQAEQGGIPQAFQHFFIPDTEAGGHKEVFLRFHQEGPVSYTHLDVYKRQG